MDLTDGPEEAAFRTTLRTWLEENVPDELRRFRGWNDRAAELGREWSKALHDAGYAGLTWPKAYGGAGLPWSYQATYLEEVARAEAPPHMGVIGLGMAGPTIMSHGSAEQKARYLPKILSAEEIWCQGFSEPGSGSDLASVRTRAELRGDVFVVDGQKVWSSFAHVADQCILLTRTATGGDKHEGLTYLIVDMHSPGVEVRPLRQITGEAEFNEIFFTGVEVPKANLLGAIGEGWRVAMTTLLHERGTFGFALSGALEVAVRKLVALVRDRAKDDTLVRDRAAREWIELQALKYTNYRGLASLKRTGVPGPEGSVAKLRWSEANQRLTKLAIEIIGQEAQVVDGDAVAAYWRYQQLRSRGNTIEAGTSEVLRNIIAERVLGLPRGR